MIALRNRILAAAAALILIGFAIITTTKTGRASGGPVVVQVAGTPTVANVNDPAYQPVQFSLLPHSNSSGTNAVYFPVPAGKRLVIDYYSSQAQDLSGGAVGLTLGTTAGGSTTSYIVFVNKNNTDAVNQKVSICADPGTFVQAFVFNGGGATSCGSLITISGHYVNIP